MNAQEILKALEDKEVRVAYFAHDFPLFFGYHFGWEGIKPFQNEWLEAFESSDDILLVAFRASRKTTIARAYCVWCIAYKKEPYIVVQSYEDMLSSQWVRAVAKLLMTDSILNDYGALFPFGLKREDIAKASFSSFEALTGVKIESKSLAQTTRGSNMPINGIAQRPTLLILDDIDVDKSTKNIRIIDENYERLRSETISSLDPTRRRIIFLGNVIRPDGIVPRFRRDYPTWQIFWQSLFDEKGQNIWPEVFNEEVIEKLKSDGLSSYNQNYLLIPRAEGETIIRRTSIKYAKSCPDGAQIVFGIDPAFSENTMSDPMGLSITGHDGEKKYNIATYEYRGTEKDEERFVNSVWQLYQKHNCSVINIESNNGGEIIGRMLKKKGMSVNIVKASKDKVTRLREFEGAFDRGDIYFLPGTESVVEQLLLFPNAQHDDMVDALVYSFTAPVTSFIGTI